MLAVYEREAIRDVLVALAAGADVYADDAYRAGYMQALVQTALAFGLGLPRGSSPRLEGIKREDAS